MGESSGRDRSKEFENVDDRDEHLFPFEDDKILGVPIIEDAHSELLVRNHEQSTTETFDPKPDNPENAGSVGHEHVPESPQPSPDHEHPNLDQ